MSDAPPAKSRVTIREVAQVANVHVSTVSRALDPKRASLVSPHTRAKILAAAEELGYRPHLIASGLRRGQTRTVGVVVPNLGNPLYAPVTHGIAHALDHGGFMPLVADTLDDHDRLERILRHLVARRVDGLITTAPRLGDKEALMALAAEGIPVVVAIRTLPGSGLPSVAHDDVEGGRLATEHLLDLGHIRLAQVPGPQDVTPFCGRTEGFLKTAEEGGAEILVDVEPATEPTITEGERMMNVLLDAAEELPTGLFAQNDPLAFGALKALRERGLRCPEDISVVGYNDVFFASHCHPPLTTIKLPSYEVGRLAATMMVDAIEDPDKEITSLTVPASLIRRESTAPPRTRSARV